MPTAERAKPQFQRSRLHFMTGMPAGETARVRDDDGHTVYSYKSFASVVGIVASLVAAIVIVAGIAATLFLAVEKHPLTAIAAMVLSVFFALVIVMLVPPVSVTLFDEDNPSLTISQRSRTAFPSVTYAVVTPDGHTLALLRKSLLSRIGRNRWAILDPNGRELGDAKEESLSRALLRKFLGKFNRQFEANVDVEIGGIDTATIDRRATAPNAEVDLLTIKGEAVDRRVLVALATLILGAEP